MDYLKQSAVLSALILLADELMMAPAPAPNPVSHLSSATPIKHAVSASKALVLWLMTVLEDVSLAIQNHGMLSTKQTRKLRAKVSAPARL